MNYDVVIIGGGVAGLTASIYSSRANLKTLIIENGVLGGTTSTVTNIENYPGIVKINGFDLIQNMYSQAIAFGVNFEFGDISKIDFDNNSIILDKNIIEYKALIIASGSSYKKLNVDDEEKYKNNGISYCAVCDGQLFKNKNIIIVTDGYIGNDSIDFLKNITENIIILDKSTTYRNDKFKVYNNVKIEKLFGEDNLNAVSFNSNGNIIKIDCDGLFVCLGKYTDLTLFEDYLEIKDGCLVTDENMHTKRSNVFVAGDIRNKRLKQIITACSDGAIAATEAVAYIIKNKS